MRSFLPLEERENGEPFQSCSSSIVLQILSSKEKKSSFFDLLTSIFHQMCLGTFFVCVNFLNWPVFSSFYLSVLSVIHLSIHLSFRLYPVVLLSLHLSVFKYIFIRLVDPSFHLCVYLSVHLSVSLFSTEFCTSVRCLRPFSLHIISCPSVRLSVLSTLSIVCPS